MSLSENSPFAIPPSFVTRTIPGKQSKALEQAQLEPKVLAQLAEPGSALSAVPVNKENKPPLLRRGPSS